MILTLKELADYLRVNERTILRMLKSGQIQGVKIGGQWRFNGSQVDQLFFPSAPATDPDAVPLRDFTSSRLPVPISRLLKDDRLLTDLQATDADGVLNELCDPIAKKGLCLDMRDLKERLHAREKLLSTGIGKGLAIPHPRDPIPALREPAVLVFGRHRKGVDYRALDGQPVHLFFLLCCQKIELHLHLMGALARMLQDGAFIDGCRNVKSGEEVVRLVMEAETRQILSDQPKDT